MEKDREIIFNIAKKLGTFSNALNLYQVNKLFEELYWHVFALRITYELINNSEFKVLSLLNIIHTCNNIFSYTDILNDSIP